MQKSERFLVFISGLRKLYRAIRELRHARGGWGVSDYVQKNDRGGLLLVAVCKGNKLHGEFKGWVRCYFFVARLLPWRPRRRLGSSISNKECVMINGRIWDRDEDDKDGGVGELCRQDT